MMRKRKRPSVERVAEMRQRGVLTGPAVAKLFRRDLDDVLVAFPEIADAARPGLGNAVIYDTIRVMAVFDAKVAHAYEAERQREEEHRCAEAERDRAWRAVAS